MVALIVNFNTIGVLPRQPANIEFPKLSLAMQKAGSLGTNNYSITFL